MTSWPAPLRGALMLKMHLMDIRILLYLINFLITINIQFLFLLNEVFRFSLLGQKMIRVHNKNMIAIVSYLFGNWNNGSLSLPMTLPLFNSPFLHFSSCKCYSRDMWIAIVYEMVLRISGKMITAWFEIRSNRNSLPKIPLLLIDFYTFKCHWVGWNQ